MGSMTASMPVARAVDDPPRSWATLVQSQGGLVFVARVVSWWLFGWDKREVAGVGFDSLFGDVEQPKGILRRWSSGG